MRIFLFCLLVVLIGGSVMAYKRNPSGCAKLGADLRAALPTIQNDIAAIIANKPVAGDTADDALPQDSPSTQKSASPQPARPVPVPLPMPQFAETTNYAQGLAEAKRTGRKVMLHFTGSDWCPYCKALDREVLATSDYNRFAGEHLITVTLDFPREAPIDDQLKQQNIELAQKYHVTGYPTLVLIDSNEHELARMEGYGPGTGPDPVIERFQPYTN